MDDNEVSLPKSTLQKSIKDLLPPDMRVAGDAVDLLVQCCNEFVHLISTQANEVSEQEKRNTINPEHILRALELLGFGGAYLEGVSGAWEEWKGEKKEHAKLVSKKSAALKNEMTQEQLVELQRRLFEEARARTLSGLLPPAATAAAAGGAAGAAQQQQQQQQQQQPEQQTQQNQVQQQPQQQHQQQPGQEQQQ